METEVNEMTRVTKTSGALRCAKKYLWDAKYHLWYHEDKYPHICNALEEAHINNEITYKALIKARSVIMRRLAPSISVADWLERNVGITHYSKYSVRDHAFWTQQLQAYRHRWVDALIKEFEAKGD